MDAHSTAAPTPSHDTAGHHQPSWLRRYVFSVDHKVVGLQYLVTALVFLFVGFSFMLLMRWQLAYPGQSLNWERFRGIAQQFGWNFHYPGPDGVFDRRDPKLISSNNPIGLDPNDPAGKDDLVSVNEMHAPVGQTVLVDITSKDVIHNYAVPSMRVAQDAIPGTMVPLWFTPMTAGEYEIVCGQLCGSGHGLMRGLLVIDSPEDYKAWLDERAKLKAGTASVLPSPSSVAVVR